MQMSGSLYYSMEKKCIAVLRTILHLEKVGITGHLRNNLLEVMTNNRDELQEGDIISFSCMLGETDAMVMCLFNISIEHHA